MKNLIRFVLIGVMTVCAALAFVACSDLKPVSAPSQLTVNDRNVLSWHEVANARSYTVDIKTAA